MEAGLGHVLRYHDSSALCPDLSPNDWNAFGHPDSWTDVSGPPDFLIGDASDPPDFLIDDGASASQVLFHHDSSALCLGLNPDDWNAFGRLDSWTDDVFDPPDFLIDGGASVFQVLLLVLLVCHPTHYLQEQVEVRHGHVLRYHDSSALCLGLLDS